MVGGSFVQNDCWPLIERICFVVFLGFDCDGQCDTDEHARSREGVVKVSVLVIVSALGSILT